MVRDSISSKDLPKHFAVDRIEGLDYCLLLSTKSTRLAQILRDLEGDLKWSNGIGTSVSASESGLVSYVNPISCWCPSAPC